MIRLGEKHQIEEIICCLDNSQLKQEYFNEESISVNFISDAISKDELYILQDTDNSIIGFIRVDLNGMLSRFPLLRCIAIKSTSRNSGLGKKLLSFYEELAFGKADKIFLCVSDFNNRAKKLYNSSGYKVVGNIDNLYKKGVNENLMMKTRQD